MSLASCSGFVRASVIVVALLGASAAEAGFTSEQCLAQKARAWATLRQCEGSRPFDAPRCQAKFAETMAKIDSKATQAEIACRYANNGDGTLNDYDTGLLWEVKSGAPGGLCVPGNLHCVNDLYDWSDAQAFAGGASDDASTLTPCFAGYCDWRLPTIVELQGILDTSAPGCGGGSPCIDPIFGSTRAGIYWSSTTNASGTSGAWRLNFGSGMLGSADKDTSNFVRVVRDGL
jgi:hypothetical protein